MNSRYINFIQCMLHDNNINIKECFTKINMSWFKGLTVYTYDNKVIGYSLIIRQASKLDVYKVLTCKKKFEDFKILLDKTQNLM